MPVSGPRSGIFYFFYPETVILEALSHHIRSPTTLERYPNNIWRGKSEQLRPDSRHPYQFGSEGFWVCPDYTINQPPYDPVYAMWDTEWPVKTCPKFLTGHEYTKIIIKLSHQFWGGLLHLWSAYNVLSVLSSTFLHILQFPSHYLT